MNDSLEEFRFTAVRVTKPSEALLHGKPLSERDLAVLNVIEEATESYHRRERRFLWCFIPLACLLFVLI
ncbi:MAG: hypothetical protein IRZ10_07665 [Thermoflavifilum sp.]|nr:hypothetical protein [Thermoflavifilum sp.]MCL6514286.1 hypothetical protein [Alicyclobacillus sp.]